MEINYAGTNTVAKIIELLKTRLADEANSVTGNHISAKSIEFDKLSDECVANIVAVVIEAVEALKQEDSTYLSAVKRHLN